MSLLSLPVELLLLITSDLHRRDLNALIQSHPHLHRALNCSLYYDNVHNRDASALFWSAFHGSIETLEHLLIAGANVIWDSTYQQQNEHPSSKKHPISFAATHGHVNIVAKFIELGVDIDYKDPMGRNPLSLAARGGHIELCQFLVNKGSLLLSPDVNDMDPTNHASVQGHRELEDFLFGEVQKRLIHTNHISAKSIIQQHLHWMLRAAAERGENDRLKLLLTNPEAELDIVPALLQKDLVPDRRSGPPWFPTPWGSQTPLISAIQSAPDPISTAKILLENGADPNVLVAVRSTVPISIFPLKILRKLYLGMYENAASAALRRDQSYSILELLLEHGLTPMNSEMTVVRAAQLQKLDEFRLLIDNGAYYRSQAYRLWQVGYKPILDLLLERGVDVNELLNSENDPFGFVQRPTLPNTPPGTRAEWAMYLNGHLDKD
jgi:ankyrin repeat protein